EKPPCRRGSLCEFEKQKIGLTLDDLLRDEI
ncbi:unnamed protein product, partial [Adineta ricciae]